MRPDNPNFRPCAQYRERLMVKSPDGEGWVEHTGRLIGFDAVGAGWHPILDELDHKFVMITGIGTEEHKKIKVLQIKEKFGGLRVYVDLKDVPEEKRSLIYDAIRKAEKESFKTCEKCGAPGTQHGGMMRPQKGYMYGRVLTLCDTHQAERETCREAGNPFEMGNGDKI